MPTSAFLSKNKPTLIIAATILLVFLGVWLFIALTRIGITPDIAFWNEAGVPLLSLQIVVSLLISLALTFLISRISPKRHRLLDLVLFLSIWALAAGVWLAQPQQQSVNAPRPMLPAYQYYPFLDATSYDLGSQYALIGQGINNNTLTDKPLYMLFLALLHLVGGQSVSVVIGLQVVVLALFPVMLFLLGKEIHSRGLGILVALLAIFKERNAIAAVLDIQVSHVKLMMTEAPTALLAALIALLLVKWARRQSAPVSLPLWVGGVIGAAFLLRANSIMFLPLALLIPFLWRGRNMRQAFLSAALVLSAFSLVSLPWLLTVRDASGRTSIEAKLDGILERYRPVPINGSGALPSQPIQFAMLGDAVPPRLVSQSPSSETDDTSPFVFVPAHFFHNQIASLLILPTQFRFTSLTRTLASPLWEKSWSGSITFENGLMLFLNLCLLALGLSLAWKRARLVGLLPLLMELLYFLANGLARTSGSRYLVPVDWVVYFYYALGLFQLADWLIERLTRRGLTDSASSPDPEPVTSSRAWIVPVVSLLILGTVMPLSALVPQRYPALNKNRAYKAFLEKIPSAQLGKRDELHAFLAQPDSVVFQGRLLYPRYLLADEGLCDSCFILDAAFGIRSYPHLSFVVLGPTSAGVTLEMDEMPKNFRGLDLSTGPDVWVMGCRDPREVVGIFKGFQPSVRGLVIAISTPKGWQLYRQSDQPLTCE